MKKIKITGEILKKLKPGAILYAEYATDGAMGACGTARIFTLEDDRLKFYLIDDTFDNKENEEVYGKTVAYLKKLSEAGKLDAEDAGFGNYAFKNPKTEFMRDDDDANFLYKKDGKTLKIPASCHGVYCHVVARFAKREMPVSELDEYLNETYFKFSRDEVVFFGLYLKQIKLYDAGRDWFDITPLDYYNAVKYLRHLSGEEYLLSPYDLSMGEASLYIYRLKYVVEKIGWNELNKTFAQLVKRGATDLFKRLDKALGEPIEKVYATLKTVHTEWKDLDAVQLSDLEKLFERPELVEMSRATHDAILKKVFESPGESFNPNGRGLGCYVANYLLNEDKLSLADSLPAVMHIIETLPDDDFNYTHTDELFWLCGQIVDQAWRYLEEDDSVQKKYRQIVYEIYWPRVGSLWPVLNRNKFEFKRESATKIFDDALSFVMSLEDIHELNAEIAAFLDANANNVSYKAGALGRRCFVTTLHGLSSKDELNRILTEVEPDDYDSFLSYPSKIEDAKNLLAELFRTDSKARITGHSRLAVLEGLLIRPNTIGVGEYILNYLDKNFEQVVEVVSNEVTMLGYEPEAVLTDLFIAISMGITEENEFPAMKKIKEKLLKLGCDKEKLDNAEKYARRHRRTILFQRSALQKFF